jgi:hypothetical protein
MSQPGGEHHSASPRQQRGSASTRRVFIGRLVGGLAIAVPAIRVLGSSTPASAQTRAHTHVAGGPSPDSCTGSCNPCSSFYVVYNGHNCGSIKGSCPTTGPFNECVGYYTKYSSIIRGYVCGTFTDAEGPCG